MMKKQFKLVTIASAACLSLMAIGIGAFAFLTDSSEDSVTTKTGTVNIDLVENFPNSGGENGEATTEKTFWGIATGTKKSLARASLFVSIEYYNESTKNWEVLGSVPTNAVHYTVTDETKTTWKEGSDGYWYYQKVLEGNPTGTTSDTFVPNNYTTTQFKITNVGIDSAYNGIISSYKTRINMLVTLETCQATNQAYKLSWENCDTSKLPVGVK